MNKYCNLVYSVDPANNPDLGTDDQILVQLINEGEFPSNVSNMIFAPKPGCSILEVMYEAAGIVDDLIHNDHRWNCYSKVYVGIRWTVKAWANDPDNTRNPASFTYYIDTISDTRENKYCNLVVADEGTENVTAAAVFDVLAHQLVENVWKMMANSNFFLSKGIFTKARADEAYNGIIFKPTEKDRDSFPIPDFKTVHLCWDEELAAPAIHVDWYDKKCMADEAFHYNVVISDEQANTSLSTTDDVVDAWANTVCACLLALFTYRDF